MRTLPSSQTDSVEECAPTACAHRGENLAYDCHSFRGKCLGSEGGGCEHRAFEACMSAALNGCGECRQSVASQLVDEGCALRWRKGTYRRGKLAPAGGCAVVGMFRHMGCEAVVAERDWQPVFNEAFMHERACLGGGRKEAAQRSVAHDAVDAFAVGGAELCQRAGFGTVGVGKRRGHPGSTGHYVAQTVAGIVDVSCLLQTRAQAVGNAQLQARLGRGVMVFNHRHVVAHHVRQRDGHRSHLENQFVVAADFADIAFVAGKRTAHDAYAVGRCEVAEWGAEHHQLPGGVVVEQAEGCHLAVCHHHSVFLLARRVDHQTRRAALFAQQRHELVLVAAHEYESWHGQRHTAHALSADDGKLLAHRQIGVGNRRLSVEQSLQHLLAAWLSVDHIPVLAHSVLFKHVFPGKAYASRGNQKNCRVSDGVTIRAASKAVPLCPC